MVDLHLILAPVLLLPVVWLLRFVGCGSFGADTSTTPGEILRRINCGGPALPADTGETKGWEADLIGTGGITGTIDPGNAVTVPGKNPTDSATKVYETWREGSTAPNTITYEITMDNEGDYKVILKFAVIKDSANFKTLKFRVSVNGAPTKDIEPPVMGLYKSSDLPLEAKVDSSKKITIKFEGGSAVSGTFAFINAIEITKK
jgi:hypothetical protein